MIGYQGQIMIPAIMASGLVFNSAVISYSLDYDVVDVMDDDNLEKIPGKKILLYFGIEPE